jgi:hypothetical protein
MAGQLPVIPLQQRHVYQTLRHWRACLNDTRYREADRMARANFNSFLSNDGGFGLRHNLLPRGTPPRTALLVTIGYLPLARLETFVIKALQMAGFEPVVLGTRRYDFLRYYRLAGATRVVTWGDYGEEADREWVAEASGPVSTLRDYLALEYRGVSVGRFAVASTMRKLRLEQLDFTDAAVLRVLRSQLEASVRYVLAGAKLISHIRPDCAVFLDPGYAAQGELFDLALQRGIDALRWQGTHKADLLIWKRYHPGNSRQHHASLSQVSWQQICGIPWNSEYGGAVRDELFQCYRSQDWFSSNGTQFGTVILPNAETRERLGLLADKKVAVVFPHIFWDGSFFAGDDLFEDYARWFVETMRVAYANDRLQWVVKLHPAHVVKANREHVTGRPQEVDLLERELGAAPPHVRLVYPDTELSTYSLFTLADYVVTVRGTVGMEAALFGIPVITAGTGRYDRRGFTIDSATRDEYLLRLSSLETLPRLSREQVELAERFAYGVLFCRPLKLQCVSLGYERDAVATQRVTVHCKHRHDWLRSPEMQALARWLGDGKTEDMFVWPQSQATGGDKGDDGGKV